MPEKVSHGAGYYIVRTPQYLLQSPVWLVKSLGWLGIKQVYSSNFGQALVAALHSQRTWGFYPTFNYGAEEGLAGGLVFHSRDVLTKGERFKIKGTYSTNSYQYYYIKYDLPHWAGYNYDAGVVLRYHWKPRERFFGQGALTSEDSEVNYALEETFFHGDISYYPDGHFGFGLELEYAVTNTRNGEDPNLPGNLDSLISDSSLGLTPASFAKSRIGSIGLLLNHDWRDNRGQPSKGGFERIQIAYNVGTGRGDDLEYWHYTLEAAQYFDVYMKRIIAVRALLDWRDRVADSPQLPIYELADLGGLHGLRGFTSSRFRDHAKILASIEYRWPLWSAIDAFLFAEGGRVFNELSRDFEFKYWESSYGGGLRVWHEEGLHAYLQVAGSDEGVRFYFGWAEDLDF
jgi:outer membrane protein assembly factor BamA